MRERDFVQEHRHDTLGEEPHVEIVGDLAGIAVVAILDLGAFARKRVRFIEQEDHATLLCRIENPSSSRE